MRYKQTLVARGHCFYWPGYYSTFSGYKTETTENVERYATTHRFVEMRFDGANQKQIFISKLPRAGFMPMDSAEDFYAYGIDVTFLGLERASRAVMGEVPPRFRQPAFEGLAVFYVNDFLFEDVVKSFRDGDIEKWIPLEYQPTFYAELGRRVRDRVVGQGLTVEQFLAGFREPQRAWIMSGFTNSKYISVAMFD